MSSKLCRASSIDGDGAATKPRSRKVTEPSGWRTHGKPYLGEFGTTRRTTAASTDLGLCANSTSRAHVVAIRQVCRSGDGRAFRPPRTDAADPQGVELCLDLLKRTLTGALDEENDLILGGRHGEGPWRFRLANRVADFARTFHVEMARKRPYDEAIRERGLDRLGVPNR